MDPDPTCNCHNTARDFYKSLLIANLMDMEFAGWMADFGEYTPMDARTAFKYRWWTDESHGEALHQSFSQSWASLNYEAINEASKSNEVIFWMRSGGRRSKYNLGMTWAGDQNVDWSKSDGLKSSIVAALSLAVSGGVGLSHSDIGGYTSFPEIGLVRSKELLLRWAEYAAFTPMMRTHETNHPDKNHQVYSDSDTMTKFARLTNIFYNLKGYRVEAVWNNTALGTPVMRPLFLDFEEDSDTFLIDYQYMFGDDLMVAPVTEPDVENWSVYLPATNGFKWIHLWTLSEFEGGINTTVEAPMGNPPVFYKSSSKWVKTFEKIHEEYS